jgi:hypothetical protein
MMTIAATKLLGLRISLLLWLLLSLLLQHSTTAFWGCRLARVGRQQRHALQPTAVHSFAEDNETYSDRRMSELEAMGGDLFFLSEEEQVPFHSKESSSSQAAWDDIALMEERKTEILEMGGDPFFLSEEDDEITEMDNDDDDNTSFPSESSFQSLVRSGGDPFFLSEENDIQDEPIEEEKSMEGPSDLFLSMAMSSSGGGGVTSVAGKGTEESSSRREIKEEDEISEIESGSAKHMDPCVGVKVGKVIG